MPVEIALVLVAIAAAAGFALGLMVARRPEWPQPPPESSRLAATGALHHLDDRFAPADQLGIGLIALDPDGRIRTANESAVRLLRLGSASLAGRTTMEAFIDHTVEELVEAARGGTRVSGEITQTGEPPRTLEVHAWPAKEGVWIALVDVSELHRLRRIRTEFVDNLAHELRTPLSTVRLLTESLTIEAERTELPPRVRESIGKIDVETGHLVQMVNELLDLARIEQGEAALDSERLDTAELVRETLSRLRVYAERQDVALREEIEGGVEERTIIGDHERLGQMLANLVHNAIKFSGARAEVVVRVQPDGASVVIEVEDHGPGIPAADRNRIFERFYKVDRARSRGGGGTGLGLSIARHIVERHGGRIWLRSEEGTGSRFFVSLPRMGPRQ